MKFSLFGTEIYVSFFFTVIVITILLTDRTGFAMPVLFAVIMHEMGHLFTMWLCDCAPRSVRLIPASVQITNGIGKRYETDIKIAVMGPVVNLVLFGVFYFNYLAFHNKTVLYYGAINLIVGLFNSLPVSGLDGGTVLYSLIARKKGAARAAVTLKIITALSAAVLLTAAIIMTVKGKVNLSLYIIAVYLFIGVTVKM